MKKLIAIVCAFMLATVSVAGLAAEARASQYFNSYSIGITPLSGGKLTVRFSTTAVKTSSTLGVSSFQLQKKVNGEFEDVGEQQTGSVGNDVIEFTFTRSCSAIPGELYRVEATFVCQNDLGFKSQQVYSGSTYAIE